MKKQKRLEKIFCNNLSTKTTGFTVTELIIVTIIIGILATIAILSFNGMITQVAVVQTKGDLTAAAGAMKKADSQISKYPDSVPSTLKTGSTTLLAGIGGGPSVSLEGGAEYCIEATSSFRPGVGLYSISSYGDGRVQTGSCSDNLTSNDIFLWSQISGGDEYTCGILLYSEKSYCWGEGTSGALGIGSSTDKLIPVAVNTSGVLSGKTINNISSGDEHSCVIASDDQLYCWGLNNNGQLGDNSSTTRYTPVAVNASGVLSGKIIKDISTGYTHSCAIASDNFAYCWGRDISGQLGNDALMTSNPVPVAVDMTGVLSGKTILSISLGTEHTCVIASDHKAYCWGENGYGQVGNNATADAPVPVAVNTAGVLSGKDIESIVAGDDHTCAIASDHNAYCWGYGIFSQLGNKASSTSLVPVAVDTTGVLNGLAIESLALGNSHTCAIASNDKTYCWGDNDSGQIGDADVRATNTPIAVKTSGNFANKSFKQLSIGESSTCAIASDNFTYCWGEVAEDYRLGSANVFQEQNTPTRILSTDPYFSNHSYFKASQIATGSTYNCAIDTKEKAYCWGSGSYLGNIFPYLNPSVPYPVYSDGVLSGKTIKKISSNFEGMCAIASDNNAYCWGFNNYGILGNNTAVASTLPVAVVTTGALSGKTLTAISVGQYHACAIASDEKAYCWGANTNGQLGNNSTTRSLVPYAVNTTGALNGLTIKLISAGSDNTCVVASDYKAYCWGKNNYGQVGNNSAPTDSLVPVAVDTSTVLSGKTIKSISAGSHSCAVASDNKAYCWGFNTSGQLGNGLSANSPIPVAVDTSGALSGKNISSISSGTFTTCAIDSDGKLYCWGTRTGSNVSSSSLVPVAVYAAGALSGKSISSVSAGWDHHCAMSSDGYVYCWGEGADGQLGTSKSGIYTSTVPVQVWNNKY